MMNSPLTEQRVREIFSQMLLNFQGNSKLQRGQNWSLGTTPTFLGSSINYSLIPSVNNSFALGSGALKWSDVEAVKINGQTPLSGTKVYYVSDSSGGAVNRKLTFVNGILISES